MCGRGQLSHASFFFQAEDGIRDLVRSRGLGDVYKRQVELGALEPVGLQEGLVAESSTTVTTSVTLDTVRRLSLIHI